MTGGELIEDIAFDHEHMGPGYIDEHSGQIFTPGGVRCVVESHGYGASLWLPAPKCIEAGEGK
jgi:hypothetical protein